MARTRRSHSAHEGCGLGVWRRQSMTLLMKARAVTRPEASRVRTCARSSTTALDAQTTTARARNQPRARLQARTRCSAKGVRASGPQICVLRCAALRAPASLAPPAKGARQDASPADERRAAAGWGARDWGDVACTPHHLGQSIQGPSYGNILLNMNIRYGCNCEYCS